MQSMGHSFDELAASALAVKEAEIARTEATLASIAATSTRVSESEFGDLAQEVSSLAFEDQSDR
jgi:hypothetical protein